MAGLFPRRDRDIVFPVIGALILFIGVTALGLLYGSQFGAAGERLVTVALVDAIIVLGIQIYVGNTGVLSFGHIGFGAIAGYTFAVFAISPEAKATRIPDAPFGLADTSVAPAVALLIAVAVALVFGVLVGIGLARSGAQSGAVAATIITLALLFVTHEVAQAWPDLTGGNRAGLTFGIGDALDSRLPIYLALLGSLIVARLFASSRTGRLAIAAREDDLAARAMGVNPLVQQTAALLLSVAVVAVGSALRVFERGSILPEQFFFDYALLTLVMLIVGGRNSVTGAVLGVVVMTTGRELARRMGQDGFELFGLGLDDAPLDWIFRENLQTVFLGVSMLVFMIWRPAGILDDWELDSWLRRRFRPDAGDPPPAPDGRAADGRTELVADDVSVVFGGFRALNGASAATRTDEVLGIIGPNGAGKTTLINAVTGLVPQSSGVVSIGGTVVTNAESFDVARSGLVRTFQNLRLFGSLTVRENVEIAALAAARHRPDREVPEIDAIIAAADLWDHRDRRARELDYGNSRRLELARATAAAPEFLLLDEPTSGMSDAESVAMIEQVRHMASLVGAGVVVIDHDLAFITGIADRIVCLDHGEVIAVGTPDEVRADPAVQTAYLGTAAADGPG